jgi:RimJ/RimL family protein N-acetyltransferase
MTPEFLEALLDGDRDRASEALDVELPDGFPLEGGMRFFQLRLRQMRDDERFHAVVLEGQMIGHAGYHGPPGVNAKQSPDAIEIGYTIEEPWRGQGYATAAAAELLRRAEERGVTHYVACTAPDNEPSLAIIRKLGFQQTGEAIDEEDGLELVFELER